MSDESTEDGAAEEPPLARRPIGVALLAGLMLAFLHTVGVVVLGVLSAALTAGPATAGGGWDVVVWVAGLLPGGAAARPVLRRASRPAIAGVLAGFVAAGAYALLASLGDPASVPVFGWRVLSLVAVGLLAGLLTPIGPLRGDPGS
ncbi:hypothetical protein ER308_00465 [Egibacter rhizosphaerae]|uniref:Uncharacterized protein n=1 Tax=Egibacter rhizosphaerae TaxID=1670831 RepID=A0A411YAG2_9ACTN|nr:hypothetical protein [Egibacter rhizosphaerae]QBI18194.1 hypothetical protein ER308_00465 [Egibacter rhizosphaerae]